MGTYRDTSRYIGFRVSQNLGYLFGCPNDKDYSIFGSILVSPYLGKLPLVGVGKCEKQSGSYYHVGFTA